MKFGHGPRACLRRLRGVIAARIGGDFGRLRAPCSQTFVYQNAVADGSDHLLARALLNAHSESIPVEIGAVEGEHAYFQLAVRH